MIICLLERKDSSYCVSISQEDFFAARRIENILKNFKDYIFENNL